MKRTLEPTPSNPPIVTQSSYLLFGGAEGYDTVAHVVFTPISPIGVKLIEAIKKISVAQRAEVYYALGCFFDCDDLEEGENPTDLGEESEEEEKPELVIHRIFPDINLSGVSPSSIGTLVDWDEKLFLPLIPIQVALEY